MKKVTIYIIISLSTCLYLIVNRCNFYKEDRDRLSENQRSLLTDLKHYKFKDSLNAVSIEKLTLTVKEFGAYFPRLEKDVKELGVKVKRVESVAETAIEANYAVTAPIKDSAVIRDTILVNIKCLDFNNEFVQLSGCEENGIFKGNIKTVDTLIQVIHRVPRKFLFIRWGTKAIKQEVMSKNPYTNIVYSEYIELK